MKIQEVMKLQRKALGITKQGLADMSEIAISTIKKIESGKGNPSLTTSCLTYHAFQGRALSV